MLLNPLLLIDASGEDLTSLLAVLPLITTVDENGQASWNVFKSNSGLDAIDVLSTSALFACLEDFFQIGLL